MIRARLGRYTGDMQPPAPGPRGVLVADDARGLQLLLALVLEDLGFEPIPVVDTADAAARLAERRGEIALALLVLRPGDDPVRALRAVAPALPVIAITEGTPATADVPLLRRPFSRDDLLAALAGALDLRPAPARAQAG